MVLVIYNGRVLTPNVDYQWDEQSSPQFAYFKPAALPGDMVEFVYVSQNRRELYRVMEAKHRPGRLTWEKW